MYDQMFFTCKTALNWCFRSGFQTWGCDHCRGPETFLEGSQVVMGKQLT